MEAGFIALAAICMVIGIVIGITVGKMKAAKVGSYGVLHIDCSDVDSEPWMYLEARTSVGEITSKKQVTFDVHIIK